ncbi:MAG: DUF6054 family protein [Bacillota bacterium]
MRLSVNKDVHALHALIKSYYDTYNVIHDAQVDEETYLMVVEKFFFRNSSRASLTILLTTDDFNTNVEIVGSGGGQSVFFKFDWGAKESFERGVLKILDQNATPFKVIHE